jgi:predicted RNA binding protein YcfA (HicA-like mRNA interferase family)
MGHKEPNTGKDFVQLASKSGKVQNIRQGKGSHVIIEFEDGTSASVPVHGNNELGKGIRHKLLKIFKAAGVIALLFLLAMALYVTVV